MSYSMENLVYIGDILLRSKATLSFQLLTSDMLYNMENLAADILLRSKASFNF